MFLLGAISLNTALAVAVAAVLAVMYYLARRDRDGDSESDLMELLGELSRMGLGMLLPALSELARNQPKKAKKKLAEMFKKNGNSTGDNLSTMARDVARANLPELIKDPQERAEIERLLKFHE